MKSLRVWAVSIASSALLMGCGSSSGSGNTQAGETEVGGTDGGGTDGGDTDGGSGVAPLDPGEVGWVIEGGFYLAIDAHDVVHLIRGQIEGPAFTPAHVSIDLETGAETIAAADPALFGNTALSIFPVTATVVTELDQDGVMYFPLRARDDGGAPLDLLVGLRPDGTEQRQADIGPLSYSQQPAGLRVEVDAKREVYALGIRGAGQASDGYRISTDGSFGWSRTNLGVLRGWSLDDAAGELVAVSLENGDGAAGSLATELHFFDASDGNPSRSASRLVGDLEPTSVDLGPDGEIYVGAVERDPSTGAQQAVLLSVDRDGQISWRQPVGPELGETADAWKVSHSVNVHHASGGACMISHVPADAAISAWDVSLVCVAPDGTVLMDQTEMDQGWVWDAAVFASNGDLVMSRWTWSDGAFKAPGLMRVGSPF